MWTPLIKRILLFFPMLVGISLLAFLISSLAPGDPVDRICGKLEDSPQQATNEATRAVWRKRLGLDLPLFYVHLGNLAESDSLYKISTKQDREQLERLLHWNGNWPIISAFYQSQKRLEANLNNVKVIAFESLTNQPYQQFQQIKNHLQHLRLAQTEAEVKQGINALKLTALTIEGTAISLPCKQMLIQANRLFDSKTTWKNYVPVLRFHANNQYHRWLFGDGNWRNGEGSTFSKGIIRGDFGISYSSKESVSKLLFSPIPISLFFAFSSILLAFLISIPIAVQSALHPGSRFDKLSSTLLFTFFALPPFFVASMLLITFANPDVIALFPSSGIGPLTSPANSTIFSKIVGSLPYLVLPMVCFTYSSFAFFSRAMRSSLLEHLNLDYVRTARAKGLSVKLVVYKHVLKNAFIPFIALFAQVFPYAIGGAVLLESIFTLPGMGLLIYNAVLSQDYPIIIAVVTLSGLFTLTGTMVCDLLMIAVDPRMKLNNEA